MALPGWPHDGSPFHPGEQEVQRRVGVRDKVEAIGRQAVRGLMPEQHRAFFAQLPFVVIGAVDEAGQPWASLLFGQPGFAHSSDPRTLSVMAMPVDGDPLSGAIRSGAALGLLGIELHTRRRNRVNGKVTSVDENGFAVEVEQSFGNCPQYIQKRSYRTVTETGALLPQPESLTELDAAAIARIAAADTFFIATHYAAPGDGAAYGADVSHRGGKPGFVRVDDASTLTWPDFVGNFYFNTLGNLQANPRAGLLFPDFETGELLYVAGRGEIVWDGDELRGFAGAERLVRFRIERVLRLAGRLPLRWQLEEASPILAGTGDWPAAEASAAMARPADSYRSFRITRVERESETIKSFYLEPADALGLARHQPGQFLPIRVRVPGVGTLMRTYTLSQAANGRDYRISVKRAGVVSDYLHDHVGVGSLIKALAPRGHFMLDAAGTRPVVLLSAGVGITPMLAMVGALFPDDGVGHRQRPAWFIHAARNGRDHAFGPWLRELAERHDKLRVHVRYSQPGGDDELGVTQDSVGRIDADLLRSLLPLDDYDVYLCGPTGFMRNAFWILRGLGVAKERIHYEFFGPGGTLDDAPASAGGAGSDLANHEPQTVHFARAGKTETWRQGSLLDLAEQAGLSPVYSCRSGLCGSCATRIVEGGVVYPAPPLTPPAAGEALICCARPGSKLVLDL
ncbi:pyridoxamine 5'-phosphate oxidase family protein [Crenobacter sp. SG2303]|uniref:Pyridoxamine 5'-phosphate oxidase family protein n=1 Tax=Crenobacter oryzisoli TaxID=3056844 RepID=A0ABT7XI49_9NEIS|nr:pyridoxamine 5'-phosphate oxidase family protein [Crenobacter sp. SG2303]MDN0073456.1 pyridoxamine 5'-phosphate oxidase family protein [Crenobacter sp. SG2303]